MKRIVFSVIAYVMFFAAGTPGANAANAEEMKPQFGPRVEGCRVSVAADRQAYRFDQPVGVRLLLENGGGASVNVIHSNPVAVWRFEVRQPNGEPAPLTLEGARQQSMGDVVVSSLDVGKSETSVVMLSRLYDMTLLGEYTVTASRQVWRQGQKKPTDVTSNMLKITIAEHEVAAPKSAAENEGSR